MTLVVGIGGETMYLYIKQRVFSIGDKYDVYDQNNNVIFDVKSKVFSIGAKIQLCNTNGQELYYIQQKLTLFLKRYEIYRGNQLCARVQQEFRFFKPKLTIESDNGNYDISGSLWDLDFEITSHGNLVGSVHKKWLSWGDAYELYIPDGTDYAFFASLVIAIDNCIHNENK